MSTLKENDTKKEREYCRFQTSLDAYIYDNKCSVLNISQKGILMTGDIKGRFFKIGETIPFKIKIKNKLLKIRGDIKWVKQDINGFNIGIFVKFVPTEYLEYLENLYSEESTS